MLIILPAQEFSPVFVKALYIPPATNANIAIGYLLTEIPMPSLYLLETSITLNWRVKSAPPQICPSCQTRGDNPFDHVFSNMHIILKHAGHARTVRSPVSLPSPDVQFLYQKTEALWTVEAQDNDGPSKTALKGPTGVFSWTHPEKLIPHWSMLHQGLYWKCNDLEMHQNITKYREQHPFGRGACMLWNYW